MGKPLEVTDMFTILIVVIFSQLYTNIKTHEVKQFKHERYCSIIA